VFSCFVVSPLVNLLGMTLGAFAPLVRGSEGLLSPSVVSSRASSMTLEAFAPPVLGSRYVGAVFTQVLFVVGGRQAIGCLLLRVFLTYNVDIIQGYHIRYINCTWWSSD
jgi:hypothetical protein